MARSTTATQPEATLESLAKSDDFFFNNPGDIFKTFCLMKMDVS